MTKFQILIFGASSTHGNWDEHGGWAHRIREMVIQKVIAEPNTWKGHVFNLGVPGDTTSDLIRRMESEINARLFYPKTIIVVSIGTNDSRVKIVGQQSIISNELFQRNQEQLFKIAKTYSDMVICVGLTPVDETRTNPWDEKYSYLNKRIKEFNAIMKDNCNKFSIPFVDVFSEFQFKNVDLLSDGLHPNTDGHKRIFELASPYIDKLLLFSRAGVNTVVLK